MPDCSPHQLIAELTEEGAEHGVAMLAVAFDISTPSIRSTTFIHSGEADPLQALTDAIQRGGLPLGIIVADAEKGRVNRMLIKARAFPGMEPYKAILQHLTAMAARTWTEKQGGVLAEGEGSYES